MIKLGIISGDNTGDQLKELLQTINDLKIIGVSAGHNELSKNILCSQAETVIDAADAILFDQMAPSFSMVKQAIQKRKNLFLSNVPTFSDSELKQLINLSQEAGSIVQFFISEIFHGENYLIPDQIKTPFLANIRMGLHSEVESEMLLFRLLLLFVLISNSEFRRADLMTIPYNDGTSLIESRIVLTSGSVIRILFSRQIKIEDAGIEIFQLGQDFIKLKCADFSDKRNNEPKRIAIEQFMNAIHSKPSVTINFSHILQAQRIFQNLRAKMNYSGGFSSSKRYAV